MSTLCPIRPETTVLMLMGCVVFIQLMASYGNDVETKVSMYCVQLGVSIHTSPHVFEGQAEYLCLYRAWVHADRAEITRKGEGCLYN